MFKDFDYRVEMCNSVHEGCELEDIIHNLTKAAKALHAFEDHYCQIVLIIAEKLCTEYIRDTIQMRQCDWEEYSESCSDEVFSHFTGGAKKFTQEAFETYANK